MLSNDPAALALQAATRPAAQKLSGEHRFFSLASLAMLAITGIGFAPSFYLRGIVPLPHPFEPLVPLVVLHGLLFSTFLLLFVAQTWLVAAGRSDLHRRVGKTIYVLLPLMIVVGLATGLGGVSRPLTAPPGISPFSWLAVPLLNVPVFGTLLTLGIMQRFRSAEHKRYMYLAMTDMMAPGFGRMPLPVPPAAMVLTAQVILPALLVIALIAWDIKSTGRPNPISIIAGSAVIAVAAATPFIWNTSGWLHFAQWVSLPFR
jgi:hypothetical protein